MKELCKEKSIVILLVVYISLVLLDYMQIPSLLGFDISNINCDFCMGVLNVIVVVILYIFTYKTIDRREAEKEHNKKNISKLFMKDCYKECLEYIEMLNQSVIKDYIVSKIDFNSSSNTIIINLQNSPFANENIIMDLVKDGQLSTNQINDYLKIKRKYRQYIQMRIIVFDAPHLYEPLQAELCNYINKEVSKLNM